MAEAAMNFRQVLASLTTAPAERFGESKRSGSITVGFDANLAVVERGSLSGCAGSVCGSVQTLRQGKIIYQAVQ